MSGTVPVLLTALVWVVLSAAAAAVILNHHLHHRHLLLCGITVTLLRTPVITQVHLAITPATHLAPIIVSPQHLRPLHNQNQTQIHHNVTPVVVQVSLPVVVWMNPIAALVHGIAVVELVYQKDLPVVQVATVVPQFPPMTQPMSGYVLFPPKAQMVLLLGRVHKILSSRHQAAHGQGMVWMLRATSKPINPTKIDLLKHLTKRKISWTLG